MSQVCSAPAVSAALAFALFALFAAPATAKELTYTLRSGETVESVARHYYGASWKAVYILGRNRLASSQNVRAGQRLFIPTSWIYTVRRGDYPTKLAKRYLGDSGRYVVLVEMNGLDRTQELKVGQELLMPFHITYVVEKGDSLSNIAKRFYRTTRRAQTIKDYNRGGSNLHPGDRLTVPIFDRATLDAKRRGPPPPPGDRESESESEGPVSHKLELDKAIATYREGDFGPAAEQLEILLEKAADNGLPPAELSTTLRYLGFCAVAFDDPDMAREYFRQWLKLEPRANLDPADHSPKIIAVFEEVAAEGRD